MPFTFELELVHDQVRKGLDQCQSIWGGRIASRADPFACHASASPFNLGLRQGLDCCGFAPYLYLTNMTCPCL